MLKKKANGVWSNILKTLQRKDNGVLTHVASVKKRYNGAGSSVFATAKTKGGINYYDPSGMQTSYTVTLTTPLVDGVYYESIKLGSRTGSTTGWYSKGIFGDISEYFLSMKAGEKLNIEYYFRRNGANCYWGKIVLTYTYGVYGRDTYAIVPQTYQNQTDFQVASFTAPTDLYIVDIVATVGCSNSSCASSYYGTMNVKSIYTDSRLLYW